MRRLIAIVTILTVCLLASCNAKEIHVGEAPINTISETPGRGEAATPGDLVTISYRAVLPDGRTLLRDPEYRFELGAGTVVSGIDDAVNGMRVGGRRVVLCPPHKHWGRDGYGSGGQRVPRNTDLTFHIALTDIE